MDEWIEAVPLEPIDVAGARVMHLHIPKGTVVMPEVLFRSHGGDDDWCALEGERNELAAAWGTMFPPALDVAPYHRVRLRLMAGAGPVRYRLDTPVKEG